MKKQILIAIFALLSLASCQKSGMQLFRGDYSFKTSGSITVDKIVYGGEWIEPVSFSIELSNEIGQLTISDLGNEKDSVLVVMNTLGGDVIVTHAFCDGNEIFLKEFEKRTKLFNVDSITLKNDLRVQASGQIYEDNTIIFNMIYEGEAETLLQDYRIHGDNIRMVATRN